MKTKQIWIAVTTNPETKVSRVEYVTTSKSDAESIVGLRVIGPMEPGKFAVGDTIDL